MTSEEPRVYTCSFCGGVERDPVPGHRGLDGDGDRGFVLRRGRLIGGRFTYGGGELAKGRAMMSCADCHPRPEGQP